jgi:cytochrome o ubiquinol oxidase operon protein cyoD
MNDNTLAPGLVPEKPPGTGTAGGHGSWHGYLVGYLAATLLTGAAFALARNTWMTPESVVAAVTVLAIAQMLVHLIFFLHINTAPEQRTNIVAFATTMLIILIVVLGSLWIMAHLRDNMMPAQTMDAMMRMQR